MFFLNVRFTFLSSCLVLDHGKKRRNRAAEKCGSVFPGATSINWGWGSEKSHRTAKNFPSGCEGSGNNSATSATQPHQLHQTTTRIFEGTRNSRRFTRQKARLSKEAAGDTEIAKKADADTHNGKEPAADTENGKESAADTENGKESAADTVLAVTEFVNDADGGKKYNFRPRNLHQASSDVQDKILEEDEDDDEDEDDEQVEDEDNKVTPTKINPNLARIKDKVNRGRPVKPVSPKGILLNVSF